MHPMLSRRLTAIGLLLLAAASIAAEAPDRPTAPPQPEHGFGSSDYKHAKVTQSVFGRGGQQYWVYEPDDPKPEKAEVVVFLHGWLAMNPRIYGAWIRHIVRRGHVVIVPRWQASILTDSKEFTPNALASLQDAFRQLASGGHVRPASANMALVGHSAGGVIAANLAAIADAEKLPHPVALMSVQPGISNRTRPGVGFPLGDLSQIPADVLMLTLAGEADLLCSDFDARTIIRESKQVPDSQKNFVRVRSDLHGDPWLVADHMAPVAMGRPADNAAPEEGGGTGLDAVNPDHTPAAGVLRWYEKQSVNAADYYIYWKLFDALADAAFNHDPAARQAALGDTPAQRDSGRWSDGVPVKEPQVLPVK
jgi:pimeloyl-ACP methyl ester carboxylesterase